MTVEICDLGPDLAAQSFLLASERFNIASTVHRALGQTLAAYRDYLRQDFSAMVGEGLSVAAVDQGQVVGCVVATDLAGIQKGEIAPGPFAPIAALTQSLLADYPAVAPGHTMLVDMAVVAPGFGGQGIYKRLRLAAESRGRTAGFSCVLGELSSPATQRVVVEQMGHRILAQLRFADFEFEGRKPFASITDPKALVLTEGKL